jgi:mRNA-degrading endonuclease toxin of MazEF toxin-antitoxin module
MDNSFFPPRGDLTRESVIHCGQIHTVDRAEFNPERCAGQLTPSTMEKVNHALKISLDLE